MNGILFNVQRYSIHDGGGIRTLIFFKGCPLTCPWCSNPESRKMGIQVEKADKGFIRGTYCKRYNKDDESIMTIGENVTLDEVIKQVEKDRVFYKTSKGGVTLSGGEVLTQSHFAIELAKELKKLGINIAIETSGMGNSQELLKLAKYVDTVLYDLKIIEEEKCKQILGGSSSLIINNFRMLIKNGVRVIPRIPLIPGYTTTDENIMAIIEIVKEENIQEVHLLPFHQYGSGKYEYLDMEYNLKDINPPTKEEVNKIKEKFEIENIKINIGGK